MFDKYTFFNRESTGHKYSLDRQHILFWNTAILSAVSCWSTLKMLMEMWWPM